LALVLSDLLLLVLIMIKRVYYISQFNEYFKIHSESLTLLNHILHEIRAQALFFVSHRPVKDKKQKKLAFMFTSKIY
jgi:hypothetical protein